MWTLFKTLLRGADIVIAHEFKKPPYGGGNQFLLALRKQLKSMGVSVGTRVGRNTKAILMNSFNFDADDIRAAKKRYPKLRVVHRLAGPIGVYRGTDIEIDRSTQALNAELADATIFQSRYSADAYEKLGLAFKNPTIIHNAVDQSIFYPSTTHPLQPTTSRKIRLIATAWSDNPKKGGPLLAWLDEHLDHGRYDLTFVGRTKATFKNARAIGAVPSGKLADILREHDIYIAPSQDDPCSNALLEALACGLPAAFLESGGHPELVASGGVGFSSEQGVLGAIDLIANDWQGYRSRIVTEPLRDVARRYLALLS